MPYGEYVPFRRFIPRFFIDHLFKGVDQVEDMDAGNGDRPLMQTAFGPTSTAICYEADFPRWPRRDAARGAKLLVSISNDAWFTGTPGPYQLFGMGVLRSIEDRLTQVRAANTGISGVIDPYGVVTASLDYGTRGRLDVDLPLKDAFPNRSFYARHGDWFGGLCLALSALALLL
jgi:apolipoprotein N-acyltransferase